MRFSTLALAVLIMLLLVNAVYAQVSTLVDSGVQKKPSDKQSQQQSTPTASSPSKTQTIVVVGTVKNPSTVEPKKPTLQTSKKTAAAPSLAKEQTFHFAATKSGKRELVKVTAQNLAKAQEDLKKNSYTSTKYVYVPKGFDVHGMVYDEKSGRFAGLLSEKGQFVDAQYRFSPGVITVYDGSGKKELGKYYESRIQDLPNVYENKEGNYHIINPDITFFLKYVDTFPHTDNLKGYNRVIIEGDKGTPFMKGILYIEKPDGTIDYCSVRSGCGQTTYWAEDGNFYHFSGGLTYTDGYISRTRYVAVALPGGTIKFVNIETEEGKKALEERVTKTINSASDLTETEKKELMAELQKNKDDSEAMFELEFSARERNLDKRIEAKTKELEKAKSDKDSERAAQLEKELKELKLEERELSLELARETWGGPRVLLRGMTRFLNVYNQFEGIGNIGALFLDSDSMREWRKSVEDAFCSTIILGGAKCWRSLVCESYIDNVAGKENFLVQDSESGALFFAGHIEGEVSAPGVFVENGTVVQERVYKVTYSVTNPEGDNSYNIQFRGDGVFEWYPEVQELKKGETKARLGSNAIVAYSRKIYGSVCIVLTNPIDAFDGSKRKEICSQLGQYEGGRTEAPRRSMQSENEKTRAEGEGF